MSVPDLGADFSLVGGHLGGQPSRVKRMDARPGAHAHENDGRHHDDRVPGMRLAAHLESLEHAHGRAQLVDVHGSHG